MQDGLHKRRLYHATIDEIPQEDWEHYEMTPSAGGPPILFHLFWLDLFSEKACNPGLFFEGFGDQLDELRNRVQEALV